MQAEKAVEARARRAARRVGLAVVKSREKYLHLSNRGKFMLIDPNRNWCVAGERFNMTAEDVIAYCEGEKTCIIPHPAQKV